MNTKKEQDERMVLMRRKIQSDAYQLLIGILLVSIVVQQFFLKAPFSQFAVEFFCVVGCGLYLIIRNLTCGIDIWKAREQSNKSILINAVSSCIVFAILFVIFTGEFNLTPLISISVLFVLFNFSVQKLMQYLTRKKQTAIDAKLDEDEMSE